MRAVAALVGIVLLGFFYIPLGWAALRACYRIVGSFWGLW